MSIENQKAIDPNARVAAHAKAFIGLETKIHDLAQMAEVAAIVLHTYDDTMREWSRPDGPLTAADLVKRIDRFYWALDFSIERLRSMAIELRQQYEGREAA